MKSQPVPNSKTSEANSFAAHGFLATQTTQRLHDVVEIREFGPLSLIEIAQSAGSYPDDGAPEFNLQTLTAGNCAAQVSFGGLRVDWACTRIGDIGLAPANTHCSYDVAGDHAVLAIPLPSNLVREVADDVMPRFNGDFGWLHSKSFRVEAVGKQMHTLWHAAAGNCNTLYFDVHTQTLILIENLLRLSADPAAIKQQRHCLAPHALQRVLDYIHAHLADDVSLPSLAKVAGLSDYYFMRSFKAEMGITAHQYVMQERIYKAVRLLRATRIPIAQVALDCGFSSQQHLSKAFHSVRGRTPRNMRATKLVFH